MESEVHCPSSVDVDSGLLPSLTRYHRRMSHHGGTEDPLLPELDEAALNRAARSIAHRNMKVVIEEEAGPMQAW